MKFVKSKLNQLDRSFFERPADVVAQELLGAYLSVEGKVGKVIETEAYMGEHDLACHAAKGRTPRTEVLFGPGGFTYVYFIYGMHWLFNVVAGERGTAAAVLIRALEPMGETVGSTNGPAKLTKEFAINGSDSGIDLIRSARINLSIPGQPEEFETAISARINIDYAGTWADEPLRFYIKDNRFVSRGGKSSSSLEPNKNRT